MIKRVNFTGRRRIARDHVKIEVFDGQPRTFSATIDLKDTHLFPHAAVFLEAMCAGSNIIERFECGEVESLQPVQNRPLREIDGENVFFTLKVVDRTERFGRILGVAENIRPERAGKQTAAGRRGILPIEPRDLGEEIWQLDFKEHDVFLLVNKDVPGLVDRARSDPIFYATVYPEVVRRVLLRAFALNVETGLDRDDEHEDCIEDVVESFCEKHGMKSKYLATVVGANGGDS
jgi:hypothetical protein